jgi:predicted transcriptional regulator
MDVIQKPTDSELDILNILWKNGPSTVREVHEELGKSGYTTTLKLMQIMLDKKLVTRKDAGKGHIYEAAVSQEKTQGHLIKRMIDNVFNGSASQLIMQALGNHKTNQDEIDAIKKYLDEIEKKNNQ